MGFLELLLISIGLAMDAFAVSISTCPAIEKFDVRSLFRVSFHFGLFQFLMPVVGWAAARSIASLLTSVDHWIAFCLLAFIGLKMVKSGINPEQKGECPDPSQGWTLLTLSIAVSIDALAVGVTFGMLHQPILIPGLVIGVTTTLFSLLGMTIGHYAGLRFGPIMELIGGLILIFIGLRILSTHLWG